MDEKQIRIEVSLEEARVVWERRANENHYLPAYLAWAIAADACPSLEQEIASEALRLACEGEARVKYIDEIARTYSTPERLPELRDHIAAMRRQMNRLPEEASCRRFFMNLMICLHCDRHEVLFLRGDQGNSDAGAGQGATEPAVSFEEVPSSSSATVEAPSPQPAAAAVVEKQVTPEQVVAEQEAEAASADGLDVVTCGDLLAPVAGAAESGASRGADQLDTVVVDADAVVSAASAPGHGLDSVTAGDLLPEEVPMGDGGRNGGGSRNGGRRERGECGGRGRSGGFRWEDQEGGSRGKRRWR